VFWRVDRGLGSYELLYMKRACVIAALLLAILMVALGVLRLRAGQAPLTVSVKV
jgi:hypothetical protein